MIINYNLFSIIKSKINYPTLKYQNDFIHSYYNPVKEGEKIAESVFINSYTFLIILGMGLGYHILPFLQKKIKNILVIDCHPYSWNLLKKVGFEKKFESIKLFNGFLDDLENWLYQKISEKNSNHLKILEHASSIRISSLFFKKAKNIIKNVQKHKLQSYFTTLVFSRRWHENSLKNIKHLKNSYQINTKTNIPIIIIGSGASFDFYVNKLNQLKKRFIIMALAPVADYLINTNIEPDFVIAVDGGIANRIHFKKKNYNLKESLLITPLSVNPYILRCWKGLKMIINYYDLFLDQFLLSNLFSLRMQPNVALSAFQIAQYLTSGDIIFLGLDFAFTYGKYHFKGNALEEYFCYKTNRFITAENELNFIMRGFQKTELKSYKSKKIITNLALESYLSCINDLIKQSKRSVYTLDKEGALIKGVRYLSFDELCFKYNSKCFKIKNFITPLENNKWSKIITQLKNTKNLYEKLLNFFNQENSLKKALKKLSNKKFSEIVEFSESRFLQNNPEGLFNNDLKYEQINHISRSISIIKKILIS